MNITKQRAILLLIGVFIFRGLVTTVNNNFKKKETKSITAQYHRKAWWEEDDYDESQWSNYKPQQLIEDEIDDALILEGYDESKFASVDDYLDYLMTVSEQNMTTKEFNDYEYHILGIRY